MLECLVLNAGRVVSKEKLLSAVASWNDELTPNAVEVYVSRLRTKLGDAVIITGDPWTRLSPRRALTRGQAPRRAASIRQRLLALLVVPAILVLFAGTVSDYVSSINPVRDAYDRALTDAAIAIAGYVRTNSAGHIDAWCFRTKRSACCAQTRSTPSTFEFPAPDGSLVAGDKDLPQAHMALANPSLQTAMYRGQATRIVSYRSTSSTGIVDHDGCGDDEQAGAGAHAAAVDRADGGLRELVAILALVWLGVSLALQPLHALRAQIAQTLGTRAGTVERARRAGRSAHARRCAQSPVPAHRRQQPRPAAVPGKCDPPAAHATGRNSGPARAARRGRVRAIEARPPQSHAGRHAPAFAHTLSNCSRSRARSTRRRPIRTSAPWTSRAWSNPRWPIRSAAR